MAQIIAKQSRRAALKWRQSFQRRNSDWLQLLAEHFEWIDVRVTAKLKPLEWRRGNIGIAPEIRRPTGAVEPDQTGQMSQAPCDSGRGGRRRQFLDDRLDEHHRQFIEAENESGEPRARHG